jgi:hypothetical protein
MKMSAKPYNGHPSWNAWNVSLWINNDEKLYIMARQFRRGAPLRIAAKNFVNNLKLVGIDKTPDGAPFTIATVSRTMSNFDR